MPTRYLKPGIRDSESIDSVSPQAECLFYRLLVTVDDFGRFDARPSMIKAACFPIKEELSAAQCADLLNELVSVGLIVAYSVGGKPYLQMLKWDNEPRAKASKYPAVDDGCIQVHASVRIPRALLPVTETETETETGPPRPPKGAGATVHKFPPGFDQFWDAYPTKKAKDSAAKAFAKRKPDAALLARMLLAIEAQKHTEQWAKDGGRYIPMPATWLNQGRWDDELQGCDTRTADIFAGAM